MVYDLLDLALYKFDNYYKELDIHEESFGVKMDVKDLLIH